MIDPSQLYKTVLETERLLLRYPTLRDAEEVFAFCRDPRISKYSAWDPHENLAQTKRYLRYLRRIRKDGVELTFCICRKSDGRVIGTCSFVRMDLEGRVGEVGYCIAADCWQQGYGSEAVAALLDFGFQTLRFNRIEARVVQENRPSAALLEHLGFEKEGLLKNGVTFKGAPHDLYLYAVWRGQSPRFAAV